MIRTIASHEWRVLARSPFAWIAAGLLQLVFGWLFLSAVEQFANNQAIIAQRADSAGLSAYLVVHWLAPASIVFLLATPLICMQLIAGEHQSGRFALLASAPVTAFEIVAGKFIGATVFQYLILLFNAVLASVLLLTARLDLLHLLSAYLGLALFIAAATAVSMTFSAFTHRPVLAAFSSFCALLMLWLLADSAATERSLQLISPAAHMNSFMRGVIDSRDVVFFLTFTAVWLLLCCWRVDKSRHIAGH